jgi:sigma-E factor negative regulatory protein RseA
MVMEVSVMEKQSAQLSALLDDELAGHEAFDILKLAASKDAPNETWRLYALIGDHLRGEAIGSREMTSEVMARIRAEPVVLAPRSRPERRGQHPLLALAASVAGVAVVAWLALGDTPTSPLMEARPVAAVLPAPTFAVAPMRKSWPTEGVVMPDEARGLLRAQQVRSPAEPRFRSGVCELRCEK